MKKSIVVCAVGMSMFVSATSFGRLGDGGERFTDRPRAEWKPEVVSYTGEVRIKKDCENCGKDQGSCELEFVREDGEEFDLDTNAQLVQTLSQNPRSHLKVKLVAEKKSGFLFWGGGLAARTFEVIAELPAHLCLNQAEKTPSQMRVFPRGKAAL